MYTAKAPDLLEESQYVYLQNVRAYLQDRLTDRAPQSASIYTAGAPVYSLRRMNDTTPAGPPSGYVLIYGAAGLMYVSGTEVASGLTGNPVSLTPFRPNTSVQPWMYIADSAIDGAVTVSDGFTCAGMIKVRSDGLARKDGIKEPQLAPVVSTAGTTTTGTDNLPATTFPWTNAGGVNSTYNYGQRSTGSDGTNPVIIALPVGSQSLTLAVTGTALVNGAMHGPGDVGPTGTVGPNGYPANFTGPGPTIVVGAFTDGSGNVLTGASPVPLLANVGAGITLQVPCR